MSNVRPAFRWLALFAGGVLVVGCGKQKELPTLKTVDPVPAIPQPGKPVTEDECREFGQQLEKAVADGDKATVDKLLRLNDLYERSISDLDISADMKKSVIRGANKSGVKFSEQLIQITKAGGTYSLLRVRTVEGRPHVLFRFLGEGEGLNYYEFTLVRYPDGQIATEDIHIYANAEPLSKTFRRLVLGILAEQHRGAVGQLTKSDQLLTNHLDDLKKMTQQLRNGQPKEAYAGFSALPAELQKNKMCQLIAIQAASRLGDDAVYLTEVERFRRDHPGDPAMDLLTIDYYAIKKQVDEALKVIDRLDQAVGGDPYLAQMKVGLLLEAGRFKEARLIADAALKENAKFVGLYWVRITVAAKEKNHADMLRWLKKIADDMDVKLDLANMQAADIYADFVKSPQFEELKQWLDERKK